MEMTLEDAYRLVDKRLNEYPQMKAVAANPEFVATLERILNHEHISLDLLPTIQNQILIILSLYAPLSSLPESIESATGISKSASNNIVNLIEILILNPVRDELVAYEEFWDEQLLKETTSSDTETNTILDTSNSTVLTDTPVTRHSSTENQTSFAKKPLTREEVLRVLTPTRTMESDSKALDT